MSTLSPQVSGAHAQRGCRPRRKHLSDVRNCAKRPGGRRGRPIPECSDQLVRNTRMMAALLQRFSWAIVAISMVHSVVVAQYSGHHSGQQIMRDVVRRQTLDEGRHRSMLFLIKFPTISCLCLGRYAEVSSYDFATGAAKAATPNVVIGHFTQVPPPPPTTRSSASNMKLYDRH